MSDESKKLELFKKEWNLVAHSYADPIKIVRLVRNGWVGGFEEALKIVDENLMLEGYDRDNALDYVRRAILLELGLPSDTCASDKQTETNFTLCPYGFRSSACNYDGDHNSCGKTFDDCNAIGNVLNFGSIGYDNIPSIVAAERCTHSESSWKWTNKDGLARFICNECSAKHNPDDYCDCRHNVECDSGMRHRCQSASNLERIERLESRDKVLADRTALLQAARNFYGVTTDNGDK